MYWLMIAGIGPTSEACGSSIGMLIGSMFRLEETASRRCSSERFSPTMTARLPLDTSVCWRRRRVKPLSRLPVKIRTRIAGVVESMEMTAFGIQVSGSSDRSDDTRLKHRLN